MNRLAYVGTLLREFVAFARANKAWWIVPLVVVLGLVALLAVASQATSPYIYTLF